MAAIRPTLLEDLGLSRAVQAFARDQEVESGIPIAVETRVFAEPNRVTGVTVFRAAQEAIMNARKHASAEHIRVMLESRDGTVVLEVADDGRGRGEEPDGLGLSYMRDRVASLGGSVTIDSVPGQGTTVRAQIPVEDSDGTAPDPGR